MKESFLHSPIKAVMFPPMQFSKPQLQRTQVVAIDAATRKSKSFTVYGVTPAQFVERVRRQFRDEGESREPGERKRKREPVPT